VEPQSIARGLGASRVLVGLSLLLAPTLGGAGWLGRDSRRPAVRALLRALGVRDLILGGLVLHVADRPGVGYRTVATAAVADAVDFVAFTAARDHLTRFGGPGVIAMAAGGAASHAALAAALRGADAGSGSG
jgi:hypothetical protein